MTPRGSGSAAAGSGKPAVLSRLRQSGSPFTSIVVALGFLLLNHLVWYAFGLRLALVFWTITALGAALIVWLLRTSPEAASAPHWVEHIAIGEVRRFQSDLATRRLADVIGGAQPGRGFSNHQLARALRDVTVDRLVRRHGADPDAPLTTGSARLSKDLARYLATAEGDDSPAINRRTLHRHLKEIESL